MEICGMNKRFNESIKSHHMSQNPPYVSKAAAADGNTWKMIYHEFQARKEEAHLHGELSCG
jgi:hypothetical protein